MLSPKVIAAYDYVGNTLLKDYSRIFELLLIIQWIAAPTNRDYFYLELIFPSIQIRYAEVTQTTPAGFAWNLREIMAQMAFYSRIGVESLWCQSEVQGEGYQNLLAQKFSF